MSPEKIEREHLERRAVVYVRQSTADQVRHHLESQRRQYDLVHRAREMGWRDVDVIDDDLGKSGASADQRTGFQRLVAGVCLNEIGAVFCLEASRLARNTGIGIIWLTCAGSPTHFSLISTASIIRATSTIVWC